MSLLILYGVLALGGIITLVSSYRSGHFFLGVLLTVLQGMAALFAVNVAGSLIGVHLNINPFSICVSGIFGTAGVALMLLMNSIIK